MGFFSQIAALNKIHVAKAIIILFASLVPNSGLFVKINSLNAGKYLTSTT